jgi:hypothetical protein
MIESESNQQAESLISGLIAGTSVSGMRFGGIPQILFSTENAPGEPYINLGSAWCVYPERPAMLPAEEQDTPGPESEEAEIALISTLRHKVVAGVEVLHPWPHLVLTFTDGSVLFLNGKNDVYEPWQAGLAWSSPQDRIDIIACPGGELAFVLPAGDR